MRGPGGPGGDRRLRGVERRRRRGLLRGRPPDGGVERPDRGRDRPGGLLRLPGQPADGRHRRDGAPADHLADHPDRRGLSARPRPRRDPDPRHRAEHALAAVLRRAAGGLRRPRRRARGHPRCAARRHPAHPTDPGHRHRHRARPGRPAQAGAVDVRGTHRDRRGLPGRLRPARHPRRCPTGRRSPTTSPSRPAPRRRWPCSASSRTCWRPASRSGTCPRTPAPGSAAWTSWPRRTRTSPTTSARSRRPATPTELPEASGEAIAREFERYLKRRDGEP